MTPNILPKCALQLSHLLTRAHGFIQGDDLRKNFLDHLGIDIEPSINKKEPYANEIVNALIKLEQYTPLLNLCLVLRHYFFREQNSYWCINRIIDELMRQGSIGLIHLLHIESDILRPLFSSPLGEETIPARVIDFTGREQELEDITSKILEFRASRVCTSLTIHGLAGIGKSTLTIEAIHKIKDYTLYPDGILWLDCEQERGRKGVNRIYRQILEFRKIHLQSYPTDQQTLEYYAQEIQRRYTGPGLLILDQVEQDLPIDQVVKYLQHTPITIIITTREPFKAIESEPYPLGPLNHDEAKLLYEVTIKTTSGHNIEAEKHDYDASKIDGNPFNIKVTAASRAVQKRDTNIQDEASDASDDIFLVLDPSLESLSVNTKNFLAILGMFNVNSYPLLAIHAILKEVVPTLKEEEREDIIDELKKRYLITIHATEVHLHGMVRSLVSDKWQDLALSLLRQGLEGLIRGIKELTEQLTQKTTITESDIRWIVRIIRNWQQRYEDFTSAFMANIRAIDEYLYRQGNWSYLYDMRIALLELFERQENKFGQVDSLLSLGKLANLQGSAEAATHFIEQAQDITNTITIENPNEDIDLLKYKTRIFLGLGYVAHDRGYLSEAKRHYSQALQMANYINQTNTIAEILHIIGCLSIDQGDNKKAHLRFNRSLKLAEKLAEEQQSSLVVKIHTSLGCLRMEQGIYIEASEYFNKALTMIQGINKPNTKGNILLCLGRLAQAQGRYGEAHYYYEQSLQVANERNRKATLSEILLSKGKLAQAQGDYKKAADLYQQALKISREIQHRSIECEILLSQGDLESAHGQFQQARNLIWDAEAIASGVNRQSLACKVLLAQGKFTNTYSMYDDSANFLKKALETAKRIGQRAIECEAILSQGRLAIDRGDYLEADKRLSEASKIAVKLGHRILERDVLLSYGRLANARGRYSDAFTYHKDSLTIAQSSGDRVSENECLLSSGYVAQDQGDYTQASQYYQQSLDTALKLDRRITIANASLMLGSLSQDQGIYDKASEYYKDALSLSKEIRHPAIRGAILLSIGCLELDKSQGLVKSHTPKIILGKIKGSLDEARKIAEGLRRNSTRGNVYLILGRLALRQGDYELANKYLGEALDIARTLSRKSTESDILIHMGRYYLMQGKHSEALEQLEEAKSIASNIKRQATISDALLYIGKLHSEQKAFNKATDYLQQAYIIAHHIGRGSVEVDSLFSIGKLYIEQGEDIKAEDSYKHAYSAAKKIGHPYAIEILRQPLLKIKKKQLYPLPSKPNEGRI